MRSTAEAATVPSQKISSCFCRVVRPAPSGQKDGKKALNALCQRYHELKPYGAVIFEGQFVVNSMVLLLYSKA